MEIIRAGMDETLIERMSAETGLPADFIAYLTLEMTNTAAGREMAGILPPLEQNRA